MHFLTFLGALLLNDFALISKCILTFFDFFFRIWFSLQEFDVGASLTAVPLRFLTFIWKRFGFSHEIYSVVSTHPKCACGGRGVNNFEKKCLWRLPHSYFVCLTSLRVSRKCLKLQRRKCFSHVPLIALHRLALDTLVAAVPLTFWRWDQTGCVDAICLTRSGACGACLFAILFAQRRLDS